MADDDFQTQIIELMQAQTLAVRALWKLTPEQRERVLATVHEQIRLNDEAAKSSL